MIQVTAAIIKNDDKLLICQRPKGKRCEFLWEFPGGKIEEGETPEECLERECYEELGVKIKAETLVIEVEYDYSDVTVNIHFYVCKIVEGEPTCLEHNNIKWATLDDIFSFELCPADKKMLNLCLADIKNML